jgi:hypothetical protein
MELELFDMQVEVTAEQINAAKAEYGNTVGYNADHRTRCGKTVKIQIWTTQKGSLNIAAWPPLTATGSPRWFGSNTAEFRQIANAFGLK